MSDFMINGRKKGKVKLAPADIKGLKKVLIALKNGEAVGILPDQVADKGEGELANFFGRPAYTMVLISKLIKRTDAAIIMAYGERLKNGNGFNIHVEELKRKPTVLFLKMSFKICCIKIESVVFPEPCPPVNPIKYGIFFSLNEFK